MGPFGIEGSYIPGHPHADHRIDAPIRRHHTLEHIQTRIPIISLCKNAESRSQRTLDRFALYTGLIGPDIKQGQLGMQRNPTFDLRHGGAFQSFSLQRTTDKQSLASDIYTQLALALICTTNACPLHILLSSQRITIVHLPDHPLTDQLGNGPGQGRTCHAQYESRLLQVLNRMVILQITDQPG